MASKWSERIAGFAIVALILYIVGSYAYILIKHKPRWTEIQDPNKLIDECTALLSSTQASYTTDQSKKEPKRFWLPEGAWSDSISIRNLEPVAVRAFSDYIMIHLTGGGIGPARGYLVYPDRTSYIIAPNGLVIHGQIVPGIYKYKTRE